MCKKTEEMIVNDSIDKLVDLLMDFAESKINFHELDREQYFSALGILLNAHALCVSTIQATFANSFPDKLESSHKELCDFIMLHTRNRAKLQKEVSEKMAERGLVHQSQADLRSKLKH